MLARSYPYRGHRNSESRKPQGSHLDLLLAMHIYHPHWHQKSFALRFASRCFQNGCFQKAILSMPKVVTNSASCR